MKKINNLTILTLNTPNITDFAKARNDLLETVKTDWALFVDQDEELSHDLETELAAVLKSPKHSAYALCRKDLFLGSVLRHGENSRNRFVRLMRVGSGHYQRPVHEVWVGTGRVGQLSATITHHLGDLTTFLSKINTYSTLEAGYRYRQGSRATLLHIAFFPFAKLVNNLIVKGGIRDGVPGMIMAGFMSFHSYLTWSKLYLLWQHK